jgi:dTDP-4-dehydrorhamnose reductase
MSAEILIIGGGGMLARAFAQQLKARNVSFRAIDVPQIDFNDAASIERAVEGERVVLNCAAFTDVNGAETREPEANVVNGSGVGVLAARCKASGALLVHYSTDYVFDGTASVPYDVDHPRKPINAYGRSKAIGEELLERSGAKYLLLRTSWLYAPWGKNFVLTMRGLMSNRPEVQVVRDQVGRPTSAQYLATRTQQLIERGAEGTYHVTNGGQCSWYELASAIAEHEELACRVAPTTAEAFGKLYPGGAQRPAYSVFDLSKTDAAIGPSLDWRQSLHAVLREVAAGEMKSAG